MADIKFAVSLPTDQGFIGRACPNAECGRYYRLYADAVRARLFCPYCGADADFHQQHTADQALHLTQAATEKAKEFIYGELDRIMGELGRQSKPGSGWQITYKQQNYRAKEVQPEYQEREVDSELNCPDCHTRFQVLGIFGYCPGCRSENLLIYDANVRVILQEIEVAQDKVRALRHAYSDLVSAFEAFSKKRAQKAGLGLARFQDLSEVRKLFRKSDGQDVFDRLTQEQHLVLRRVFQKRHAAEHSGGVIDDKYVRMVPEDSKLLGTKVVFSIEEFLAASNAVKVVLERIADVTEPKP